MSRDKAKLSSKYKIRKFSSREAKENNDPDEISEFDNNKFLTEGIVKLWRLVGGIDTSGYYSESNAHCGVGNGSTSESEGQTSLQGGSTYFKSVNSGYPTVSGDTITFQATFGETEANFDWNEFTVVNTDSDTGENINRKVSDQGTKNSGAIWELEIDLGIN